MVTIYTERGPATEVYVEKKPFNFGRLAAISLGSALLMSLVAAYNLNSEVQDLTQNKLANVQQQLSVMPVKPGEFASLAR